MTKEEMMRPCTLPTHWKKKEPIDACEVSGVQSYYEVGSKDKYHITINFWNGDTIKSPQIKEAKHYDCANAKKELNHIQSLIYDALNGDVLATEEVLAGLPKDAKATIQFMGEFGENHCGESPKGLLHLHAKYPMKWNDFTKAWWVNPTWNTSVMLGESNIQAYDGYKPIPRDELSYEDLRFCYIQPNGCPKTAEYLRQFTLDGVRRVG